MSKTVRASPMADISTERRRHSGIVFSSHRAVLLTSQRRSTTPSGSRRAFALSSAHTNSPVDRTLSPVSWRHNPYGLRCSSPSVRNHSLTAQLPGGPCVTVSTRGSGTGHAISPHRVAVSSRSTPLLSRTDVEEWRPLTPVHSFAQDTQEVWPRRSVSRKSRCLPHATGLGSPSVSSSGFPAAAEAATPSNAPCRSSPNAVPRSFSVRSSQSSVSARSGTDGLMGSFFTPAGVSMCSSALAAAGGHYMSATPRDISYCEMPESQWMSRRRSSAQAGVEELSPHEISGLPMRPFTLYPQTEDPNSLSLTSENALNDCSSQGSRGPDAEEEVENENDNNEMEAYCATLRPNDVRIQLEDFRLCENTSGEDSFPATAAESFPYNHANSVTVFPQGSESQEPHANPLHGWATGESDEETSLPKAPPQELLCVANTSIDPSTLPPSPRLQSPASPFGVEMMMVVRGMATGNSSPAPQTPLSELLNIPPTMKAVQLDQLILSGTVEEVSCAGGFYFSVYGADLQQHYVIESSKIIVTRGTVRYLALYELHGTQSRVRFQLCKRYLQSHCIKGINCQYIHTRDVPSPTWVHINENVVNPCAMELHEYTAEELRGGKNTQKYMTLPSGVEFRLFPPNKGKSNPQIVPSEMILYTLGSTSVYSVLIKGTKTDRQSSKTDTTHDSARENNNTTEEAEEESTAGNTSGNATGTSLVINNLKPRHCAHFQFSKMCKLGTNCNFIHSLVPYVHSPRDSLSTHSPLTPQRCMPQAQMHTNCESGLQMLQMPMHSYGMADARYGLGGKVQQQPYFPSAIPCGLPPQPFQFASSLHAWGTRPFATAVPAFGTIPHGY